jgi:hypothetical protein
MRSRALIGLPRASSSMALMPDPPMSIESVIGAEPAREAPGTAVGSGTAAVVATLGLIRLHFTE